MIDDPKAYVAEALAGRDDGPPAHFDDVPPHEEVQANGAGGKAKARRLKLIQAADFVAGYVAPEYLLDGILQRGRVYSMTGSTGHGKTAVTMALAAHAALGQRIAGREIEAGRVVYLAAENPDDVQARAILLADRMGLDLPSLPLHFISGAFDLLAGLDQVRELIAEIGGASLIVADTGAAFAAASGVDDENSNLTMLRFAYALRALSEMPGRPCALALMHPIKRIARADELLPRGGGAFLAEMDGNLTMFAEGDRKTTELHWTGKFRGPPFYPIPFALEGGTCATLKDAKGRQMPSVWARPIDEGAIEAAAERVRGDEDQVLIAMLRHPGLSLSRWADLLGWRYADGKPAKSRVQRTVERLAAEKPVSQKRGRWELTASGKKEAEKVAP